MELIQEIAQPRSSLSNEFDIIIEYPNFQNLGEGGYQLKLTDPERIN